MSATLLTLKGPALLARAGVTLNDAKWLFSQRRAGNTAFHQDPRFAAIQSKVSSFVCAHSA